MKSKQNPITPQTVSNKLVLEAPKENKKLNFYTPGVFNRNISRF